MISKEIEVTVLRKRSTT